MVRMRNLCLILTCLLLSAACAKTTPGENATHSRRAPNLAGVQTLLASSSNKTELVDMSVKPELDLGGKKVTGPFNDKSAKMKSTTVLTLKGAPNGSAGTLVFDLYLLGTWDEEGTLLADEWRLTRLGAAPQTLLSLKTFGEFPSEGRIKIGRHELDIHRKTMRVPLPALGADGMMKLEMRGFLTGQATELWAIDAVRVEAK